MIFFNWMGFGFPCSMSEDDLLAKLREANIVQLSEVKAIILETTGDVSVIHGESEKAVDDPILKNIRTKI